MRAVLRVRLLDQLAPFSSGSSFGVKVEFCENVSREPACAAVGSACRGGGCSGKEEVAAVGSATRRVAHACKRVPNCFIVGTNGILTKLLQLRGGGSSQQPAAPFNRRMQKQEVRRPYLGHNILQNGQTGVACEPLNSLRTMVIAAHMKAAQTLCMTSSPL